MRAAKDTGLERQERDERLAAIESTKTRAIAQVHGQPYEAFKPRRQKRPRNPSPAPPPLPLEARRRTGNEASAYDEGWQAGHSWAQRVARQAAAAELARLKMEHAFEVGELEADIRSLRRRVQIHVSSRETFQQAISKVIDGLVEASTDPEWPTAAVIADGIVGPLPTPTSPDPPAIIPPGSYMYELGPGSNSDISHRQSMMKYV